VYTVTVGVTVLADVLELVAVVKRIGCTGILSTYSPKPHTPSAINILFL
jgi:hypothetical protein